jgi:DNA-binding NtrC family response regulator
MIILFIDDEPHYILPYTQAFALKGFDVKVVNSVDEAWKIIESSTRDILAIIVDIMMPPGKLLESESTKQGLRTGEVFIEKLKTVDEGIPVVVLTNAEKAELGNISHRNCLIFPKKEISPWGLVDKVSEMKRKRF